MEFDSLVLVELAVDLSRRFDTDISHEENQEAGNVARTVELLKSKRGAGLTGPERPPPPPCRARPQGRAGAPSQATWRRRRDARPGRPAG
ncbi:hypothetical protein ACHZ98_13980 [Streptomyces sp. MAR4 CNY-716]